MLIPVLVKTKALALIIASIAALHADSLTCSFAGYKATPGLTASAAGDTLTVTWDGEKNQELKLRFAIQNGTPTIQELAARRKDGAWVTLASNATPDFRVVSGLRRITRQQLVPLMELGVKITQEIIDQDKWEAFWDAPLNIPGGGSAHGSTPPEEGTLNQPGLPRKREEVTRATATYRARSCDVKTNGARLEVSFPGVQLGVFAGRLQYTVYQGTNLIRQEVIAKTDEPSVAYKYDAGIQGLAIQPASRIVWRDLRNQWKDNRLGGGSKKDAVIVRSNNRLIAAEMEGGSIAAFPPPHNFFWAREVSYNLGYNWYRKDGESSFSFGVRQAENEESPREENRGSEDRRQNFALRSARPGTWQRMPVYFYAGLDTGAATLDSALAFTREDHFKPLPGYQVMATHFHMAMFSQAMGAGGIDAKVPDLEVLKAAGVNIVAPIDGGNIVPGADGPSRGGDPFQNLALYYEAARRHSDSTFLVMPNAEVLRGEIAAKLGAHSDVLMSHQVFWSQGRAEGKPLVESDRTYGKIYHVGSAADMLEMAHRENMLIYMPHPRSKGSTGFPDAIKDSPHFLDPNYRGAGFRWGMGLDGSEQRLCEYRCLPVLDDMNNWVASKPTPPKYLLATSELYQQGYGDDIYANNPVNYVKLDALPQSLDWSPIVSALKRGDYFVTSGEVLIPSYAVEGTGNQRTIVADVEWTFPLEFVEVVWGDGQHTYRQIVSATDLPAFGRYRFQIPFNAEGKKWVRFAAWDSAGNGALVQPIKLTSATLPR